VPCKQDSGLEIHYLAPKSPGGSSSHLLTVEENQGPAELCTGSQEGRKKIGGGTQTPGGMTVPDEERTTDEATARQHATVAGEPGGLSGHVGSLKGSTN
jgi:hypothetical protein